MNLFWRLSLRDLQSRPVRKILTLLGIIIGTSAVVSVTLTTSTVRRAQSAMFTTITGKTELEVVAEGGGGFDETIVDKVLEIEGVQQAVPTLLRPTVLSMGDKKARTQVMGIDTEIDSDIRTYELTAGKMIERGNQLLIDDRFAKSLGIQVGDQVKLLTRSGPKDWLVHGLVRAQGGSALAQGGILFAPIVTLQTQFRTGDTVDKVELRLKSKANSSKVQNEIAAILPSGLKIQRPSQNNQIADQALNATEQGLRLATAFALLIAVFIIYNTFQMVVSERRRVLGILRAIGATRSQISGYVLKEAILLGIVGTFFGSIVGVFGAKLLTWAMAQTLQSDMPSPQLALLPFALAACFGIGVAWLGAYFPAKHAGKLSPMEAMQVMGSHEIESSNRGWILAGMSIVALGVVMHLACLYGQLSMTFSVPASILILIGVVLTLPLFLVPTSKIVEWVIAPFMGVEARLAQKQLVRHRGRTALTTGVLFIAISTGVGLACTIIDNVRDVDLWCSRALVGDFFVRAAMPDLSTGKSTSLPESFGEELKKLPGIKSIDSLRLLNARSNDNSIIVVVREFKSPEQVYFDILKGDEKKILPRLFDGDIVMGSVLAERLRLNCDDLLPLETLEGPKELKVAAIVNDYIGGGLTIYMHRKTAETLFHVQGEDAYIIRAAEGQLAEVGKAVESLSEANGLLFQSNASLVEVIRTMSNGVIGSLWGLLALGSAIASFGLINTLSMNILEQTREIGLLRVVAMTRQQIRLMVVAQAILLGLIGFVPGTLMGLVTAYLINLSTYTATGHAIGFVFRPGLALASLTLAFTMAILASLIPAEHAARIRLSHALRHD